MGNNLFQNRISFSVFVWLVITINFTLNYASIIASGKQAATEISRTADNLYTLVYPEKVATIITEQVVKKEKKAVVIPTNDLQCMAENIFYESATQSYAGKIAVGQVVLNRLKDPRYPNSVCGVIYDGATSTKTNVCQFSWACQEGGVKPIDKSSGYWAESMKAARELLTKKDQVIDITEGATSYHADYVKPAWSKTLKFVAQIDNHLFYK